MPFCFSNVVLVVEILFLTSWLIDWIAHHFVYALLTDQEAWKGLDHFVISIPSQIYFAIYNKRWQFSYHIFKWTYGRSLLHANTSNTIRATLPQLFILFLDQSGEFNSNFNNQKIDHLAFFEISLPTVTIDVKHVF